MSRRDASLASLWTARADAFPSSGEINVRVANAQAALARVLTSFEAEATSRDDMDGVSLAFADWRFNLRNSNTEPLLRLNLEARGQARHVEAGVHRIAALTEG